MSTIVVSSFRPVTLCRDDAVRMKEFQCARRPFGNRPLCSVVLYRRQFSRDDRWRRGWFPQPSRDGRSETPVQSSTELPGAGVDFGCSDLLAFVKREGCMEVYAEMFVDRVADPRCELLFPDDLCVGGL